MQPSIFLPSHPRPSPKDAIPYSSAALRQDLERLRGIWDDCQASRDRNAIYGYLSAVYDLVAWWSAEGREADRARRALRMQRLKVSDREEPFAAVIRCTADPAKADKRTRSKWSRVLRLRRGVQAGFRAAGAVYQAQGGHQRLCRSVQSEFRATCGTRLRSTGQSACSTLEVELKTQGRANCAPLCAPGTRRPPWLSYESQAPEFDAGSSRADQAAE